MYSGARAFFNIVREDVVMVKKEKKPAEVDAITEKLNRSEIVIATDYRGLTVANVTELRAKLRQADVEYQVVKNTLARFAANAAEKSNLLELLTGPTALAYGYYDVVQPAKVLTDYMRTAETSFDIKGGILGQQLLSRQEIIALARLPSREELISKVIGLLQSPIHGLLNVLNGNVQCLIGVIQARIKQLEGS